MATPSPYSPPTATDDVPLTRFQKACLRGIATRNRNPSKIRFLFRQWPAASGYAIISAGMFALVYFTTSNLSVVYLTGAFAIGFFVASMASLVGDCIRQLRIWPAIARVIDWDEVDRLAR